MSEICNECGRSVKPGSGNFVNRVPDCNTPEERKEMGRPHPEGDFVCAECDSNGNREEYLELQNILKHGDRNMQYFIKHDERKKRLREIEKEYGVNVTDKWLEELKKECDHEWISDGEGEIHLDYVGECYKRPVKCAKCSLLGDEVWTFSCYVRRDTGEMV